MLENKIRTALIKMPSIVAGYKGIWDAGISLPGPLHISGILPHDFEVLNAIRRSFVIYVNYAEVFKREDARGMKDFIYPADIKVDAREVRIDVKIGLESETNYNHDSQGVFIFYGAL